MSLSDIFGKVKNWTGWSNIGSFASGFGSNLVDLGAGFLSGLAGNMGSGKAARRAFQYSLALQENQNAFTERMANTAHQREVKDLLQAGLNPILSATGGSGAATPSAGSATQSPVDPNYQAAIATALDMKRLRNETKLRKSQEELNDSQFFLNRGQEASAREQGNYIRTQNELLEKYGPSQYLTDIADKMNQIWARKITTAKQMKVMDAQIQDLFASAWRKKHQALGFSESESESTGYTPVKNGQGIDITKLGRFGYDMTGFKPTYSRSRSRSY